MKAFGPLGSDDIFLSFTPKELASKMNHSLFFFQKGRKIHPNDEELGAVLFSRKVPMVPTVAKAYTSAKGLDAIARHRVKNICLGLGVSINLYLPLVLGGEHPNVYNICV